MMNEQDKQAFVFYMQNDGRYKGNECLWQAALAYARQQQAANTEAVRELAEAALAVERHLFYTIRTPDCKPDTTDLLSLLQKALAAYKEATKS